MFLARTDSIIKTDIEGSQTKQNLLLVAVIVIKNGDW